MKLNRKRPAEIEQTPPPSAVLLFDRGVYAHWYMARRLAEEVIRAQRYDRALTMMAATPVLLAGERLAEQALRTATEAARSTARDSDLIGWSADGRLLLIMPETPAAEAEIAASRLRDDMYLRSRAHGGQKWVVVVLAELGDFSDQQRLTNALDEKFAFERLRDAA